MDSTNPEVKDPNDKAATALGGENDSMDEVYLEDDIINDTDNDNNDKDLVKNEKNENSKSVDGSGAKNNVDDDDDDAILDVDSDNSIAAKAARHLARYPCRYLAANLVLVLALSAIGIVVGGFEVAIDNAGWLSRNTPIADRHTQYLLVQLNRNELSSDSDAWTELETVVQPGWETNDDDDERRVRRNLQQDGQQLVDVRDVKWRENVVDRQRNALPVEIPERLLQSIGADGCDLSPYASQSFFNEPHLWPIWRPTGGSADVLDPDSIFGLCAAEQNTQRILEAEQLCNTCGSSSSTCLPPYSLVLYIRLRVGDVSLNMGCAELRDAWADLYTSEYQQDLQTCAALLKNGSATDVEDFDSPCFGFGPTLIDEFFDLQGSVTYSSSVFATPFDKVDEMYAIVDSFDRGSAGGVVGAYDTQYEQFNEILVDDSLSSDMLLAAGSAIITLAAIMVHTRSLFLSLMGLLQIILSFPVAFFVYTFIAQLEFFPFLNFIGVFVVFALGADDIFVAVDKWKNARLTLEAKASGPVTVAEVATLALPDAATAMFLTTLTTAVAFFGTAVCPVAPIRCFAVFVGLLIVFDYFLCIVLVFPALCIYDLRVHPPTDTGRGPNCFWHWQCAWLCGKCQAEQHKDLETDEVVEDKPSLIRRILSVFYAGLHRVRWVLLVACAAALIVSGFFAAKIDLPTSSDVRLLNDNFQFELNFEWRRNLLSETLEQGSITNVVFGSTPADTGDVNDPNTFSTLKLDNDFQPSLPDAQVYLRDFCDRLFANEFVVRTSEEDGSTESSCAINQFEAWLNEQGALAANDSNETGTPDEIWIDHCAGVSGLPLPQESFDDCITNWSQNNRQRLVLSRNGVMEVLHVRFQSRVRYDSPFADLDAEWHMMEEWFEAERQAAPAGLSSFYHTSADFWWYDTNGRMLDTAFTSASIAIGTGAAVILFSSRSLTLTIFSAATIGFVLASVTACLVSLGWTLGFLESICFAILIGISCDFVIHFSHAYAALPGDQHRSVRTKHALIQMGPSILAAAFTTMASATIMLFTVITFFEKFAVVLFLTVVLATVGSFVVFLTLADCVGPSQPTAVMDMLAAKVAACCGKSQKTETTQPSNNNDDGSSQE